MSTSEPVSHRQLLMEQIIVEVTTFTEGNGNNAVGMLLAAASTIVLAMFDGDVMQSADFIEKLGKQWAIEMRKKRSVN